MVLVNGKWHIVSDGKEGKIDVGRRIEDGKEVGTPMDAAPVIDIAVAHDGKWVVVTVWNAAERHSKVTGLKVQRTPSLSP
jgi:hypothetical protein